MKKLLFIVALFIGVSAFADPTPANVSEKILKSFKQTFGSATNVTWHEFSNYMQANFKQNTVQIRAQYDDEGHLLRTIRYYEADQLPPNVSSKLNKKYEGKEITGVTETSTEENVSYLINIKDAKYWYIVESDVYGNLDLKEKFKRADN